MNNRDAAAFDPSFTLPLPTPAEMNGWDAAAAEMGLKTELLMENAARAAYCALAEKFGPLQGKRALCFAGPGNNGGDAIALARHLHDAGAQVTLLLTRQAKEYRGAAGFYLRLARRAGVEIKRAVTRMYGVPQQMRELANIDVMSGVAQPDIIVDGLLGTGLTGDPRPPYDTLIETLNHLGQNAFVLALDIPSGLSGLTGQPAKHTVAADLTVTFEAVKLGLAMHHARPYTGEIVVPPIGIPRIVREARPPAHQLLAPGLSTLLPKPDPTMHKCVAGKLLVVGGSPGLTGAPLLAALGALRAGVGLVTVACPQGIETSLKAGYPDIMTLPLGQGRQWTASMAQEIAQGLDQYDALVIGPGIGRGPDTAEFLSSLAKALNSQAASDSPSEPNTAECLSAPATPHGSRAAENSHQRQNLFLAGPATALGSRAAGDGAQGPAAGHVGRSRLRDRPPDLRAVAGGHALPIVWDADALFWLAANPQALPLTSQAVITPHPGEAARLLNSTISAIEADRPGAVRALAARTGATAILKGPATLLYAPDTRDTALWPVLVSPFMEQNLSVGGSGDVLAGVIGSLLARDVSPLLAASLGVYWHGLAGRLLSGDFPHRGNLASEIAGALPRALTERLNANRSERPNANRSIQYME